MKKSIVTSIVVFIWMAFLISCNTKTKKETPQKSQQTEVTEKAPEMEEETRKNPFFDMRNMAYKTTAEQIGLDAIDKDDVYGIISELDMNGATVTVVTFATGDTSIYLSSGGGFIGAGQHESVREVVKKYVINGQRYVEHATKIENLELPAKGMATFNFMTPNGNYCFSKNINELNSGNSEFSNLFAELNEVISQIRVKSGQ